MKCLKCQYFLGEELHPNLKCEKGKQNCEQGEKCGFKLSFSRTTRKETCSIISPRERTSKLDQVPDQAESEKEGNCSYRSRLLPNMENHNDSQVRHKSAHFPCSCNLFANWRILSLKGIHHLKLRRKTDLKKDRLHSNDGLHKAGAAN